MAKIRGTTCPDDFPLPKPLSLSDYAKANPVKPPGFRCWACTIPERAEIDQARRDGMAVTVIREWLIREKGYAEDVASRPKLDRHFSTNRHHERAR